MSFKLFQLLEFFAVGIYEFLETFQALFKAYFVFFLFVFKEFVWDASPLELANDRRFFVKFITMYLLSMLLPHFLIIYLN